MIRTLSFFAHHGRLVLIAGLLAGVLLPGLAAELRRWIPELVALLLFLTAFRIGPAETAQSFRALSRGVVTVLSLQLLAPLALLAALHICDVPISPLLLAVILVLAAPSVTGSANFAILLGHAPAPALRLMILGTALLPVTCIPVLALVPQIAETSAVLAAATRLFATIAAAAIAGFALRHWAFPALDENSTMATDGITTLALAIIVVGLMSAIQPAFLSDPLNLLGWLGTAFALNFGAQFLAYRVLRLARQPDTVQTAIIAGNRNFALFFVALSPELTQPLLIFLGCYQFPMYLTPTLLRRLYAPD